MIFLFSHACVTLSTVGYDLALIRHIYWVNGEFMFVMYLVLDVN